MMKNDKLNLWRAVYAERCKYDFRREYGTVEVDDRLCLPHEIDNDVQRLKIFKISYDSQRYTLQDNFVIKYPKLIRAAKEKLQQVSNDAKKVSNELRKELDFEIVLNGIFTDNRADAGNMIIEQIQELKIMEEKVLGSYHGFGLSVLEDESGRKKFVLKGASNYDTEISTSPVGLIVRLENLFEGIPERDILKKKIEDYERDMESLKEQYGRPFEYEEELNRKLARQSEINNMLDLENGKVVKENLDVGEKERSKDIEKDDIGKENINKDADRGEEYGTVKM